jgi:penicillin-binding protein 1A
MIMDAAFEKKVLDTMYKPKNYADKYFGPVTMRTALQLSLNSATLRMAEAVGLEDIAALAAKLGVAEKLEPVLAMALGAIETTPIRQVTAYSMIANGGRKITPTLVDRIQDRYGRIVFRHDGRLCSICGPIAYRGQSMPALPEEREQVLDEDNAYQIVTMLQDSAQRSPAVTALALGRRVAGKTGTTNDGMDAWFVGFSSDLAVAVWIGYDAPRTLGPNETGALAAGPIFADFMRDAIKGRPARDFVRPKGIVVVGAGSTVEYYKRGTEQGPGNDRAFVGYVPKVKEPESAVLSADIDGPDAESRLRIPPPRYGYVSRDEATRSGVIYR